MRLSRRALLSYALSYIYSMHERVDRFIPIPSFLIPCPRTLYKPCVAASIIHPSPPSSIHLSPCYRKLFLFPSSHTTQHFFKLSYPLHWCEAYAMAGAFSSSQACVRLAALLLALWAACAPAAAGGRIDDGLEVTWGDGRGSVSPDGQVLSLSLDHTSGSGFRSKDTYLFARADVQIKLVPNNSAGTVTTFYFISEGPWDVHDEIDLEFLGNSSGEPYTLHTNVYASGNGSREQQFHLWFDPAADFHTYSVEWTQQRILVLVDGTPIREFKNHADRGVPYPSAQRMRLYGTLWNADDWATQGGRVKTDWSLAPFVAQYRNFTAAAPAADTAAAGGGGGYGQQMDAAAQQAMKWARDNYMVYDYCADTKRFPQGVPPECSMP